MTTTVALISAAIAGASFLAFLVMAAYAVSLDKRLNSVMLARPVVNLGAKVNYQGHIVECTNIQFDSDRGVTLMFETPDR